MTIDLLAIQDAKVHRCECGSWVYGANLCRTCEAAVDQLTVRAAS